MHDATYWIKKLKLQKHPEGGWYREVYRSTQVVNTAGGLRPASTSIYYLLEGDDFSAFHRIRSDETWHYYTGTSAIEVLLIDGGELRIFRLGSGSDENFQQVVPKYHWFAARLTDPKGFALAGCTVAPGFDFQDFELADQKLLNEFPTLCTEISSLIKG